MALESLPIQTESRQILSQAIGVVGDLLRLARGVEQLAAGFRERAAALANGDHLGKLQTVKEVNRRELFGREDRSQHIVAILDGGISRSPPTASQASDFLGDQFFCDAAALSQRGHARDRGVEVAEVAGPMSFAAGCEAEESLAGFFVECDARAAALSELVQLVTHVRLDVFRTVTQRRQFKRPKIDPGQQVLAEAA